jgi:hypothetical protein
MAKTNGEKSEKRGPSAFKLVLFVIILLLIPTVMEELEAHKDTVKVVGRVCVGLSLLFFAYGLFSKVLRFAGLGLLVLIGVRAAANEGMIELPKVGPKIQAMLDAKREK